MRDDRASDRPIPSADPHSLPYCVYPRARDVASHGLQALPAVLPRVNFTQAQPYRSQQYTAIAAAQLAPAQVLEMARVVGASFARREPQARHLKPPKQPPAGLLEAQHTDSGEASHPGWN